MKDLLSIKVTSEKLYRRKILIRVASLIILALLLLTTTVYSFVYIVNKSGNFTIDLDPNLRMGNLLMSPYEDFRETEVFITVKALPYMDNISEKWLPDDIDDNEGESSGSNYIAYTFFIKNNGEETISYNRIINILAIIRNVDEAVRVGIYFNGEKTVYAKVNKETKKPEPNTEPFVSNTKILNDIRTDFEPNEVDKYTIVIWLEGDDPECINDILGGEMKMSMVIQQEMKK